MKVDRDHFQDVELGQVLDAAVDDAGLWALVKFGRAARRLLDAGHRAVSAEVDGDGRLCGMSLITESAPAIWGARVFTSAPPAGGDGGQWVSGTWHGHRAPSGAANTGATPAAPSSWSLPTLADEQALADAAAERYAEVVAARAAEAEQDREAALISSGLPVPHWPADAHHLPMYQSWLALQALIEDERVHGTERRRAAEVAARVRLRELEQAAPRIAAEQSAVLPGPAAAAAPADPGQSKTQPWWRLAPSARR